MVESLPRPEVAQARRIVLKVGTRVLTHQDGQLALARLFSLVEAAARLRRTGREVLVVSSGAVGLGCQFLGFAQAPPELEERQACAAVGQSRLMGLYQEGFSRLGLACGQVLLTQGDFHDPVRYRNLHNTLTTLLQHGVIPVINENDAVATDELVFEEQGPKRVFGDNDRLSALVATRLEADLLVLVTDVAGVYDRDPRAFGDARLLTRVDAPENLGAVPSSPGSPVGRGGMRAKVQAAAMAGTGGCHVVIASGMDPGVLERVLEGREEGTWFPAHRPLEETGARTG